MRCKKAEKPTGSRRAAGGQPMGSQWAADGGSAALAAQQPPRHAAPLISVLVVTGELAAPFVLLVKENSHAV